MTNIRLESSWLNVLQPEFEADYFVGLRTFLKDELASGKQIYPPGNQIFAAMDACPFDQVKVVILGQDPYHGPRQANGLCFSVSPGIEKPPSLINIFKELRDDLGLTDPTSGDLSPWANQGVLLLNATLTVEAHRAGSHQNKGWETFTDTIVSELNNRRNHLVFMLWGGYAKRKGAHIDRSKHLVLESGHPSPLSANKGYWFGNRHFSKCNNWLREHELPEIDWQI
ncbi:MAG: uracil-DNA glycosylase [Flavobacteriales bacterium]|nr:uracil-DNA glycosylase [Flavobacteriales bacterium]